MALRGGGGGFRPLNLERPILINGLRGKVRTRPDIFGGRFGSRPILGQKLAMWPNVEIWSSTLFCPSFTLRMMGNRDKFGHFISKMAFSVPKA